MFAEIVRIVLYWAVILSGTISLTSAIFRCIDRIERPRRHRR